MKKNLRLLPLLLSIVLATLTFRATAAAPVIVGIRGQSLFYQPGFAYEVEPDVWVGGGSLTMPLASGFTLYPVANPHLSKHFITAADGTFSISLSPGKYELVPDSIPWAVKTVEKIQITVVARKLTPVYFSYQAGTLGALGGWDLEIQTGR